MVDHSIQLSGCGFDDSKSGQRGGLRRRGEKNNKWSKLRELSASNLPMVRHEIYSKVESEGEGRRITHEAKYG